MEQDQNEERVMRIMGRMRNVQFWEIIPDMTQSEGWLLAAIVKNESDNPKVSDLCGKVNMHPAAISRLLNGLEEKGLIERTVRKDNRRITDVRATDRGRKICARNHTLLHAYWSEVFGRMPRTDVDHLFRVWDEVVDSMEAVLADHRKSGKEGRT